jgi:hypothetical protein
VGSLRDGGRQLHIIALKPLETMNENITECNIKKPKYSEKPNILFRVLGHFLFLGINVIAWFTNLSAATH